MSFTGSGIYHAIFEVIRKKTLHKANECVPLSWYHNAVFMYVCSDLIQLQEFNFKLFSVNIATIQNYLLGKLHLSKCTGAQSWNRYGRIKYYGAF